MNGAPHGEVRYEKGDVRPAAVLRAAAIVFGVSTLVALLLIAHLGGLLRREERRDATPRAMRFEGGREAPQPRLQELPFEDVRALRRREEQALSSYGWVDRPAGVVRIPIDEAMRLYAERAVAAATPAPSPAQPEPHPPAAGARSLR